MKPTSAKTPGELFGSRSPIPCLIDCKLGHDIREDLARFVVNQGIGLLELKAVSMSLEDVFLHLTQHDEPPPPTDPLTREIL